ncbi:MAG: hypothetical protein PHG31_01180 [Candidatus Omnitrophica bacterium]|nr:hypothetical protein [Candidatus Omnitrophota bacterium]
MKAREDTPDTQTGEAIVASPVIRREILRVSSYCCRQLHFAAHWPLTHLQLLFAQQLSWQAQFPFAQHLPFTHVQDIELEFHSEKGINAHDQ